LHPIHLKELEKSIEKKNNLSIHPIIVNSDFEVIDGQHRLAAAKNLGVDIYYIVSDHINTSDIITMNRVNLKWSADEWIQYFASTGSKDYDQIIKWAHKYGSQPNTILSVISSRKPTMKQASAGGLKLNYIEEIESNLDKLFDILNMIISKTSSYERPYACVRSFKRAVYVLIFNDDVIDYEVLFKKLSQYVSRIKIASGIIGMVEMLLAIYNIGNRNPVDVDMLQLNNLKNEITFENE